MKASNYPVSLAEKIRAEHVCTHRQIVMAPGTVQFIQIQNKVLFLSTAGLVFTHRL